MATMDVGCHNEEADGRLIAAAPCLFKLLKQLCFDRGVILHATTVADSRESFREICAKHGIEVKDDVGGWQDGRTWVRPEGNRTHSE